MVFPSHGNHLSKEYLLRKISQIGRDFGMKSYRKRLGRSLRVASMEVVMRTWILLVRQGRVKERVPSRRITMMEDHYN